MRAFVRQLFARKPEKGAPPPEVGALDDFAHTQPAAFAFEASDPQPPEASPLPRDAHDIAPVVTGAVPFLCREPILSRRERIVGHELSLERRFKSRFADDRTRVRRLHDEVLIGALSGLDLGSQLGERFAFVRLAPESTVLPELGALPPGQLVLVFDAPAESGSDLGPWAPALAQLRRAGFRVGWRLRSLDSIEAVSRFQWDVIEVTASEFDGLELAEIATRVRQFSRVPKLLACELASYDDFQLCFRAGYDYFQGPFVLDRENWHAPKSDLDRTRVILVLNRLRAGAENPELAATIRLDPVLAYKLLRYINSPAMGLARVIDQIDQALTVLGRDRFYRWLSLLLFDVKNAGFRERALFEQALVRARFMEELSSFCDSPDLVSEHLFMTGLFSLLDCMMGEPLDRILSKVVVPKAVEAALLTRTGPFAPFLALAIVCESGDSEEIARAASACGVDAEVVNLQLVAALGWVQGVTTDT